MGGGGRGFESRRPDEADPQVSSNDPTLGSPFEVTGHLLLPIMLVLGIAQPSFVALFVVLALLYGILLSEMAVGIETMVLSRYPRVRDRLMLFAATFVEFLGYHQILAVERLISMFQIRRKRGI